MRLTTLGDLLLDVIVRLDGPLAPGDDRTAATVASPGGQAANVAAWAATLGAAARFVGRVGDDAAGELVLRALRGHGVDVCGPVAGRTGVVVSIAAGGDRTMASDRGTATLLEPRDLEPAWFDCDVLHVSGYALLEQPLADAALEAARLARAAGARVSLDVSSAGLLDDEARARVRELAPDLTFATEQERAAAGELATDWVLKRGARGLTHRGVDYPAVPVDVVDATGAGDALAAGFLVGGPELGVRTAARCCARPGAMP
ncbi:MAG TPA: PfkB family carbohydrate kinase [Gaiellaceae bacterium]|nr:PfkB family carbohydrate kinase [Gaiellaceae bacterium]